MSDGLLQEIIGLEKELQAELADEERRSLAWRDRELLILEEELEVARSRCCANDQQMIDRVRATAEAEAKSTVEAAKAWCQKVVCLEEDRLLAALRSHLVVVFPETNDDRSHGKG
ncbi:MAG: hypothetical protein C0614_12300 [Desulfuromonas sp.]|nr:MAG: hypothetical protein C0614_12300 [Desulfuromonas sp.]